MTLTCFMSCLVVHRVSAQPLYISVSDGQYLTYVEAQGSPVTTYPAISRTTTSSAPISDEIDQPLTDMWPGVITNYAIANAGSFTVSDQTGWGFANAEAVSQIWFSPSISQNQTLNLQISAFGHGAPLSYTAGLISLLDLTSNFELWDYSWNAGGSVSVPIQVPAGDNIPWDSQYPGTANFSFDTDFLASDQYELTMTVCSNAGDDTEDAQIQLTGLQAVPEPSADILLAVCSALAAVCRRRNNH